MLQYFDPIGEKVTHIYLEHYLSFQRGLDRVQKWPNLSDIDFEKQRQAVDRRVRTVYCGQYSINDSSKSARSNNQFEMHPYTPLEAVVEEECRLLLVVTNLNFPVSSV